MNELQEIQKEKVRQFLNDKIMSDTIKQVFLSVFLSKEYIKINDDVHLLAASRLAVNFLLEGFKYLEEYRKVEQRVKEKLVNPGL